MMPSQSEVHETTETLRARLAESEETLRAIRHGEIDALVVDGVDGSRVYTLHSAEEPYRHLVEEMQEGAVVLTGHGEILYANARFAALVGEPLESVIASRIDRFVNPSDKADFEIMLAAGGGRRRCSLIASDSGAFEVGLSLTTTAAGNGRRLNLIVTDLTELLEANRGRDRAEHDSRTKDNFLAMLGHELRTPLGAISNAVQVLRSTRCEGESAARADEVVRRQVSHVTQLINDLLDVERVVSGRIRLNRQPLDLAEAVRRAARGEPLHRPAEVNRVLQVERERSDRDRDLERRVERLTPRETQILQAMADGMSSEQIAEDLGMSRHTLRTHTQNILTRLGVHSKTDAVIAAIRFGKATPPGLASPDRDALEAVGNGGLGRVV